MDTSFKDFVLDQLNALDSLVCKSMFGGYGLYREDLFFGIIYKSRLYFKTDAQTRVAYAERGMGPFRPSPRQTLPNYYEVPAEILENRRDLMIWAEAAWKSKPAPASRRGKKKRKSPTGRRTRS